MKSFVRSVLIASASIGLLLGLFAAYVLSVHASPRTLAFLNAIVRRGVADTLSGEYPFAIWKLGSRIEIPFDVRYTREVALALYFKDHVPPGGTIYSGRLLIQYYQGNRLVQSKTYARLDSHTPHPGSTEASIVLDTQVLPLHGGPKAHSVVVEVLEADPRFAEYKDAMKMQVRGAFSW
jgi:hypothetical protein